jgi:hypothetical protein
VSDSGATQYIVSNSNSDCGGRFKYGTNYYWWVRAYDEEDKPTDWYQYNTNSNANSTGGDPDVNPLTFTTYKHEFPNPFFTWSPLEITVATTTEFTSAGSEFYDASQTAQSCAPGLCSYEWSAVGTDILILATTSATTSIEFWVLDNNTTVSLRVQDSDNYSCSISSSALTINFGLPLWHEVKAE